ncbi:uncharacterized protein B0H18DRAFT_890080, partial [Fomitopsis serialis]|uniref:uncharacterized protein n=1 Tax=Fomitopsis serialis TaxID=139415 RepID=UPI0020076F56
MSNHSPLTWVVVSGSPPEPEATIQRTGVKVHIFCTNVAKLISQLPTSWETAEDIEHTGDALFNGITAEWKAGAAKPDRTGRSKSWWNLECSKASKAARKVRKQCKISRAMVHHAGSTLGNQSQQFRLYYEWHKHVQQRLKQTLKWVRAASRRAKRTFFDNVLSKAHPQLISNFVSWAKPRRLDAGAQIKRADGTLINSQAELQEEFREQFTPSVPKAIDESILEELWSFEKRSFPDISNEEISENLADTSNTSVGGEDHVNWEW